MKQLSSSLITIITLTLVSAILFAGTQILDFHAQPGYNRVTLKWSTLQEVNVQGFEVQRSVDKANSDSFKKVAFVKVTDGISSRKEYAYEDNTVFKTSDRIFYYRLKIIDLDESFSFSKTLTVKPTISTARQTWGSIKAMFR